MAYSMTWTSLAPSSLQGGPPWARHSEAETVLMLVLVTLHIPLPYPLFLPRLLKECQITHFRWKDIFQLGSGPGLNCQT